MFSFHREIVENRFIDSVSGDVIQLLGAETADGRFEIWMPRSHKKTFTSEEKAITAFKLHGPDLFRY